jgi:hypothetical protein
MLVVQETATGRLAAASLMAKYDRNLQIEWTFAGTHPDYRQLDVEAIVPGDIILSASLGDRQRDPHPNGPELRALSAKHIRHRAAHCKGLLFLSIFPPLMLLAEELRKV